MTLNGVPMEHVTNVKYLGFMFASDSNDEVDMQKQLTSFTLMRIKLRLTLLSSISLYLIMQL